MTARNLSDNASLTLLNEGGVVVDLELAVNRYWSPEGRKALTCLRAGFRGVEARAHYCVAQRSRSRRPPMRMTRQYKVEVSIHPFDLGKHRMRSRWGRFAATSTYSRTTPRDFERQVSPRSDDEKWRHAWDFKVFGFINRARSTAHCARLRDRQRDRCRPANATA